MCYVETWRDLQRMSIKKADKEHCFANGTPDSDSDDYVAKANSC